MSTYHSVGEVPEDVDVAFEMGGRDVRLSIVGGEAFSETIHLSPTEAHDLAAALVSAANQCQKRRAFPTSRGRTVFDSNVRPDGTNASGTSATLPTTTFIDQPPKETPNA